MVDPQTPSILYAGTTNGFYKSTNSGVSWSLKKAGECWDISVHPNGGTVEILAAFGDGLFMSTNAGGSFAAVTLPSEPSSAWTRLGVDRVTTSPDVAYVFGATTNAAFLWRRTGTTWKKQVLPPVNLNPNIYDPDKLEIGQAEYDWCVAAPPTKTDEVYVGAIDTFRGQLNGTVWDWTNVTTQGHNSIHPDQHCLVFVPNQAKIIYSGNDGGIYRSSNSGSTWKSLNKGLGICEIEYLACDPNTWEGLIAGTQDNGTIKHDGAGVWTHIADGDGGDCGINQLDPNVMYHSFYDVSLERSTNEGQTWTDLEPPAFSAFDSPPTCLFYPPVEVSGLTVAIGAKSLVVTRSGKKPWDTVPLGLSSGELPSAMREIDANTLLVGTNTGRMLRMSWNGSAWKKTNLASPVNRYISCIAVDPSNGQRFWVTISQVGAGRVFRSDERREFLEELHLRLAEHSYQCGGGGSCQLQARVDRRGCGRLRNAGFGRQLDAGLEWSSECDGGRSAAAQARPCADLRDQKPRRVGHADSLGRPRAPSSRPQRHKHEVNSRWLQEGLYAAQAHFDAELKQLVLSIFRQMIGKGDDRRVLVLRERFELPACFGQDLPPARARGAGERCEPCLVSRKLGDEVVQMVCRARRIAVVEAGSTERPQHRLDMFEPARTDWRRVGEDTRRVAVRQQAAPYVPRHVSQLIPPGAGRACERDLAADLVPEQCQQFVLVPDVPIQGCRPDPEPLGQAAHGQVVEPHLIEQGERGADDLRLVQGRSAALRPGLAEGDHSHRVFKAGGMLPTLG